MTALCFVDTETTSLERPSSPTPGEVWEVGLIVRGDNDLGDGISSVIEYHWFLPVTLAHADPVSLDIGGFHERHPQGDTSGGAAAGRLTLLDDFVDELLTAIPKGAHLVGAVVSFDEERLAAILHAHAIARPPWHYHLVDVEALAAGFLAGRASLADVVGDGFLADTIARGAALAAPPWNSDDLCAALGLDEPAAEDRHTALGDARWARDIYDAVTGR